MEELSASTSPISDPTHLLLLRRQQRPLECASQELVRRPPLLPTATACQQLRTPVCRIPSPSAAAAATVPCHKGGLLLVLVLVLVLVVLLLWAAAAALAGHAATANW